MSEDEAFAGYAPGVTDRYHEAGYDAYETGMCFVNIVEKYIVGEGSPKAPDTPACFLPSDNAHSSQNAARLRPRAWALLTLPCSTIDD